MSDLFQTTRNNVTLHISNIFKQGELIEKAVCKDSLLTAADGKKYKTKIYNLDVIISVGYRVKSLRGTQFRIWANKILKDYLLKGYSVNHRLDNVENDVYQIKNKLSEIDFQIHASLPPNEGIFFDGQIFDAYKFVADLIKTANKSIILIDNYVDESTLLLLAKRNKNVSCFIYTAGLNMKLELDIEKVNQQYPEITVKVYKKSHDTVKVYKKSHDRFLIIDDKTVYHIGASLKDLGKKWFAFSKINLDTELLLGKLND